MHLNIGLQANSRADLAAWLRIRPSQVPLWFHPVIVGGTAGSLLIDTALQKEKNGTRKRSAMVDPQN